MHWIAWLLIGLVPLSACTHQQHPDIADPSKRINAVTGVSLLPPQEPGWKILTMSSYQLALAKFGQNRGETYAASVSVYNLPKVDTEDAFLKAVSEGRASAPRTGRFVIISNDEKIARGRETNCVYYYTVSEDTAAHIGTERKSMILETIGYHCQHPKNRLIGVNFEYSHRYFAGNQDPAIESRANAFLDQVRFTDF